MTAFSKEIRDLEDLGYDTPSEAIELLRRLDRLYSQARFVAWSCTACTAAVVAMLLYAVISPACGTELWREGPVMIEAQSPDSRVTMTPSSRIYGIAHIDSGGMIWRHGKPLEQVERDDLEAMVRELLAIEVMKSSPPKRRK